MRVWGWNKKGRNHYVLGNVIDARIKSLGRERYVVVIKDKGFGGRFNYQSLIHNKWVDADADIQDMKKEISQEIRRMLGRG